MDLTEKLVNLIKEKGYLTYSDIVNLGIPSYVVSAYIFNLKRFLPAIKEIIPFYSSNPIYYLPEKKDLVAKYIEDKIEELYSNCKYVSDEEKIEVKKLCGKVNKFYEVLSLIREKGYISKKDAEAKGIVNYLLQLYPIVLPLKISSGNKQLELFVYYKYDINKLKSTFGNVETIGILSKIGKLIEEKEIEGIKFYVLESKLANLFTIRFLTVILDNLDNPTYEKLKKITCQEKMLCLVLAKNINMKEEENYLVKIVKIK